MRSGSRFYAVAYEAGGRENESALGGIPGFPEGRSKVQQLLAIPRAECLHAGRRQYQSGGLVQILGQKGWLRPAQTSLFRAFSTKRRGTPVVTAPPARLNLDRDLPRAWNDCSFGLDGH